MELNNGSYYQWKNEELEASIIYHGIEDGRHPNAYGLQIHTSDGGLWCFGYLPENGFDIRAATAIVNSALAEDKDFEWWQNNGATWFTNNIVLT